MKENNTNDFDINKEDLMVKTYDVVEYLNSEEKCNAYLQTVLEEDGIESFQEALLDVAKAKMISELANKTGFTYQQIYEELTKHTPMSNDTLSSILKVLHINSDNSSSFTATL